MTKIVTKSPSLALGVKRIQEYIDSEYPGARVIYTDISCGKMVKVMGELVDG